MQEFVEALEVNEALINFWMLTGAFIVALVLETVLPRRDTGPDPGYRWINNLSLSAISQQASYWSGYVISILAAWWANTQDIGLLRLWNPGFVPTLIISILALEFISYSLHRLMHRSPLLWKIHRVHHGDTVVDFSTTFRNHPFEPIFVLFATTPFIILLGPPVAAVVLYEAVRVCNNVFAHCNVRVPQRLDSALRLLLVTPDFHRIHHASDPHHTNSNYGVFLTCFDYLLGSSTRKSYEETTNLEVGLEYFRGRENKRLDRLLTMPFRRPD